MLQQRRLTLFSSQTNRALPERILKTVASALVVLALFATPVTDASAATETSTQLSANSGSSADSLKKEVLELQETTEAWKPLSRNKTSRLLREQSSAVVSSSELQLDTGKAQSWSIDKTTIVLRIPVRGGQGVVDPSALTLFVDKSSRSVTSTVEMTFTPLSATSGTTKAWIDGELQIDRVVSEPSYSDATDANEMQARAPLGSSKWWSTLNRCLSNAGVPAWIVSGLSIVCAVACVATAGVACAACIAVAAAVATKTVKDCIVKANRA